MRRREVQRRPWVDVGQIEPVDYVWNGLRASTLGYRVIQDPYAVLRHQEKDAHASSPQARLDDDVRYFRERHRIWIEKGDPFRPIIRDGTGSDATPDFEDRRRLTVPDRSALLSPDEILQHAMVPY